MAKKALVGTTVHLVEASVQAGFLNHPAAGVVFMDRLEEPSLLACGEELVTCEHSVPPEQVARAAIDAAAAIASSVIAACFPVGIAWLPAKVDFLN